MATIVDELDKRRQYSDQVAENSARLAHAYATFETTGSGSMIFEERVDFDVTYIEQPIISYGSVLDADDLADAQGFDEGDPPVFPISSGFVVEWDKDDRGYYVGCWVGVRVAFMQEDYYSFSGSGTVEVEMTHNFTFSAVGLKDVPVTVG